MNLRTWFKGLGVFALSSMITALATMQLDPASFNFSKAGLTKVGAAALVIGVKSVLLYLKQSPLPGSQQTRITDWTKITTDYQIPIFTRCNLGNKSCSKHFNGRQTETATEDGDGRRAVH